MDIMKATYIQKLMILNKKINVDENNHTIVVHIKPNQSKLNRCLQLYKKLDNCFSFAIL